MKKFVILSIFFILFSVFFFSQQIFFPIAPAYDRQNGESTPLVLNYKVVIFNPGDDNIEYKLRVYNENGDEIGFDKATINTNGTKIINLQDVLYDTESPQNIKSVKIEGENLKCLLVESDTEGKRVAASWIPDTDYSNFLNISHITAGYRDLFFNGFSVLTLTDANLNWEDKFGEIDLSQLKRDNTKIFELGDLYEDDAPGEIPYGKISGGENGKLKGFESFGRWDESKTFSFIPISTFTNTRLVFPHIAYVNKYYWTGLVVSNPGDLENRITIRFMTEDGEVLQTQHTKIPPKDRLVFLFAEDSTSYPQLPEDIPDGVSWVDVIGEKPLTGFELFGGNDLSEADYMEGVRATADTVQDGVIPYIEEGENLWTGVALINTLSLPISVELKLLSENGDIISTTTFNLNPYQKLVGFLKDWFSGETLEEGESVIVHSSEKGALSGIVLFGDENVSPREVLGGYELIPMDNFRTHGPNLNDVGLPKFGVNFPKFGEYENITVPPQENTQNQFAWWSSGHPYRTAMRHMQSLDIYYSEWMNMDQEDRENQEKLYHNKEMFGVMPTFIGHKVEWNGIDEPEDPIDMSDPEDVSQLENYVRDVVNTYPDLTYYEMLNETFGESTLGMDNFAQVIEKIIDTVKSINPDIRLSFPHLNGTIPDVLASTADKLAVFSLNYPNIINKCDAIGLHYYGPWQQFEETLNEHFLKHINEGVIPNKPWLITETGISFRTTDDTITALNGIEGGYENQASYLVKMMTLGFKNGAQMVMHHSVQSGSPVGSWSGFGLLDNDGTLDKAAYTFRYFTDLISDFISVDAISEGDEGLWIYRYNNANNLLGDAYVVWEDDGSPEEEVTLYLPQLAGCEVYISNLVPNSSGGFAGTNPLFNPSELYEIQTKNVNDDGNITVTVSEYPIIIQNITRKEIVTLNLSSNVEGELRDLQGVIAGPAPGPGSTCPDITDGYHLIHVTSVRNNGYYDDSLDIESIFRCPDTSVYPSWDCDANDDSNYHWDLSDWRFSTIVDGGFEPFLRLGGEAHCSSLACDLPHQFEGPRENQEDSWITAAIKTADRYKDWNGVQNTVKYLDIWTEWPNQDFWDRGNTDFIKFWRKTFERIKEHFPQCKVGGPGFLKPTVDVIDGNTQNNKAIDFLNYLYQNNLKPDWIGFHMFSIYPYDLYKAAIQYRNLLDGTGDFSNVPWAGTDFFKDVEIICGAYNLGSGEVEGNEMVEYPTEFLQKIFNEKDGTAYQTSQWIALQKGGVERAYYYRGNDRGDETEKVKSGELTGWTGLFDKDGNPKPVAYAFGLRYKLNSDYPLMLKGDFYTTTNLGNDIFYLGGKGEGGYGVIVANFSENPVDYYVEMDGVKLIPENFDHIYVHQVDNTNDGSSYVEWNDEKFHIPARCIQLIEFLNGSN